MSKINQQKVCKNLPDAIFDGIHEIKNKILPKLDPQKMEQVPDEFVSEAERFKHDPDVKAFIYTKSNDGIKLIEKVKKIFKKEEGGANG
jgi:uncharacterized protein (UPF0305 family)